MDRWAAVRTLGAAVAVAALAGAPGAAGAAGLDDDPTLLTLSGGVFDIGEDDTAAEGRIELRGSQRFWVFKPFGGIMATGDSAFYGYAGVLIDLYWGRRIVTTFSFAPGYYEQGDGKDLGHEIEFRSQAEIAWRFDNRARLGVSFGHMSNAGIGDDNPGQESLMLNLSLPVGNLFGN